MTQCPVDRRGRSSEQFFEIVALYLERTFADAFLNLDQHRDHEVRYASALHNIGIGSVVDLLYRHVLAQNSADSRRQFFLREQLAGQFVDRMFMPLSGEDGCRSLDRKSVV